MTGFRGFKKSANQASWVFTYLVISQLLPVRSAGFFLLLYGWPRSPDHEKGKIRCIQTDAGGVQGLAPGAGECAWRRGRGRGGQWRKGGRNQNGRVGAGAGAAEVRGTAIRWGTGKPPTGEMGEPSVGSAQRRRDGEGVGRAGLVANDLHDFTSRLEAVRSGCDEFESRGIQSARTF